MADVYESNSDNGSDFSGFGASDIESGLEIDSYGTSSGSYDSEDDEPWARLAEWTDKFLEIMVRFVKIKYLI